MTGEGGASSGVEDGDGRGSNSGVEEVVGAVGASVCLPLSAGMSRKVDVSLGPANGCGKHARRHQV